MTSSPYQDWSLPSETTSSPTIDVLITTFEKSWVDEVAGVASELGGSEILYSYKSWGMVRTVIDKSALTQLAREPGVMWIDRQTDAYIFNDIARWVIQSADTVDFATPIHEQGIWGTGQTVTVGDTGIDYDHDAFRDPTNGTPGASHRKVTDYYIPAGATGDGTDNDINHGSHVSGTVAGDDGTWHIYDGNPSGSNGTAGPHDGQAFDAKIQVQDLSQDGYSVGTPDDMHDLFQPALDRGSYIHTNSWGDYGNQYITEAYQTDDFLWNNQDFIVCFAAGNYGPSLYSISPFAAAKNVIAVGATENGMYMENVADFSSRGPCADGRVKPDVMAPGSGTWSVHGRDPGSTQDDYWQLSGTSMATPTVAGSVALIRQYYMDGFFPTGTKRLGDGFVPSAALVKATLINSAAEMTGNGAYANGQLEYPNNNQGWGRIQLDDALFFRNDSRGASIYDNRLGLETGGSVSYSLAIGDSSMPVEITLVWTDYPGVPLTSPALVNDLNLLVIAPDGTVYRGNVYQGYDPGESTPDPALWESDHLNNVESVLVLTNPKAGLWTVTVSGYNVPSGPQPYAIVMSGGLATDKGTVRMDENVYKSSATVIVQAVDLGLNTDPLSIETVTVNMYSSTEALPEVLLLTETGADTAVFAGVIQLQNSDVPISGDVILQVQNGDNVTAEYFDVDDGLGGSGPTYDHAYVDDDPPVISGIGVINIRFNRATIVWTTDEVSNSVTRYGDSIPPNSSLSDPGFSSSHELMIRGLNENTAYYLSIESTDEAGNLAIADNGGGYYEFATTASPPAPTSSDEWPTFHNNMGRVGASPSVFSPPIEKQWNSSETYYSMFSSPIISDGMLFATSLDGVISARDAFSGDLIWDARLGDRDKYTGTPTVADGVVYTTFYEEPVNVSGGTVYALDELTGAILWSVGPETGIDFNARIAMADGYGLVFGAAWSGEIFAMNASTGAMEWIYQTGDRPSGGIAVDAGQIFIGTVDNPRIVSLDASTGSIVWERAVDVQVNSAPLVSGGCVYVGTYGGTLYCLDEWSGDVVWQVGGFDAFFYSTPAFDGSTLYFSTQSGLCYAVNAFDGSLLWSMSLSYASYGSLAYANGFLYVGMFEGYLYVIDALDGTVVDTERISDYGVSSSPSVSEGWVWIEDYYGAIHAFMGQIPVGLVVRPTSQTRDVAPSSVVDYTVDVINTGSSGADTFDAFVTLGAQGWATELFKADSVTTLPDTDGDSVPDTGPISKGTSVSVVVRVTVPGSASVDDRELAIVSFRSSIDVAVDRQVNIRSIVPSPGVDIGSRSYFQVSPGDVRTAWMNVTNTGAFTDTIDITALSLNDWNLTILSQDGVTPLPDTDSDDLQDTGPIPPFDHATISVRVEVSSAALPGMLEITTVTGTSSLDIDANDTNLFVLELPSPPNIDWPTFHSGNQRQGASPSLTIPPLDQMWVSVPYSESDWSGPVIADGILLSTTTDGLIRAHDPYTGELLWSRLLGDNYFYTGTPAVDDRLVYTISYGYGGGYMYALDETTGATIWSFGPERGMDLNARTPLAVSAGLVFGCAWDGEVFAVDANDGAEVWRYESDNFWPSGVAISGGAVYFGTADGHAFALDEFTGQLLWSTSLDGWAISVPMCADGMVYIGTDGGSMYSLNSTSGEVVWQRSVGSVWLSTPAYGNSAIFFGATYNYSDGYFHALDSRTGSTIWSVYIPAYVESSVAYANGYVFGTAGTGLLYTLSASSGSIVDSEQLADGSTSSPAVTNGWAWVQDWSGQLYAFRFAGWDVVASIEATPESAVVPIGGYTMFDVVAENRYGGVIENQTFTWTVVSGTGSLTLLDDAGESILFAAGMYSGTTVLQVSIGDISTLVQVVVPPGAVHEILVSPSEGWVTVGSTMQFTATVYDALGNEITGLSLTWTSTIGGIDSSGMLSAGTGSGTGTVTATVGSVSGAATIHVLPGPLDHISATPSSLAVVAGGMSTISVVGEDVYGNEVTGMTYSWSSTLGAVYPFGATSEALFQAGTVVGSGNINVSCGSVSTEIPISVIPGALDSLVITPSSAALTVDETVQFAVSGFDAYGNAVSGLTIEYSVSGDIGSINGTGMFTAGTSTGTGGVIATSGGLAVQTFVTIGPGQLDRIAVVSKSSVTVSAGSVVILSATGYDAHGNEIAGLTFSWGADNGSVTLMDGTSEIVYQAGTSVGSRTVTAANGSVVGSLDLSVVPGPLATLVVDPAAVLADSGDSVDLTVRGYDAYGNLVVNLAFTWSISSTSSTIDAIGTLSPHEDTKTATLIAGDGATGTITVSCGGKSAIVSVTVNESPSALTKTAPSLALAAVIAVIVLAVLLVLMLLGKIRTIGRKE
jgi:outer membrane protein assembly factor BamB